MKDLQRFSFGVRPPSNRNLLPETKEKIEIGQTTWSLQRNDSDAKPNAKTAASFRS